MSETLLFSILIICLFVSSLFLYAHFKGERFKEPGIFAISIFLVGLAWIVNIFT